MFNGSNKNDTSNDFELVYRELSNLVIAIPGIICAPIVFALLAVVLCGFRAYKTTFQRLILYHIIISLFCECSFALQIQINYPHPRWFCAIVIYLRLYFMLSWYVYTTAVTNYLFLLTLRLLRGNPKIWQYGNFAECFEFCVCLSLALPVAYMYGYQFMMVPLKHYTVINSLLLNGIKMPLS
jgi:hypothetical protein